MPRERKQKVQLRPPLTRASPGFCEVAYYTQAKNAPRTIPMMAAGPAERVKALLLEGVGLEALEAEVPEAALEVPLAAAEVPALIGLVVAPVTLLAPAGMVVVPAPAEVGPAETTTLVELRHPVPPVAMVI